MTTKKLKVQDFLELSESELLKQRFKSLPLSIVDSDIEPLIKQFYKELEQKHLQYKPQIFLGDEWFSPEGMNAISVPFYLAHPKLKHLERSKMLEVEGGDPDHFMKLLRHEAGHCFDHCYKVSKRKKWRKIFGSPEQDYKPDTYRPQPYSRSYVKHLDRWYAQAHPDEDFAETFAVWLNPDIDWKKDYADWPVALAKLKYVESLVKESHKLKNTAEKGRPPCRVTDLSSTLEKYYLKKKKENADEYPDFYDSDLKKIFTGDETHSKKEFSAEKFMIRHRKQIVNTVAWATHEKKITIDSLVKRLVVRCKELDLRLGSSDLQTTMEVSSFLTSLVKNYLFTGKFKRTA